MQTRDNLVLAAVLALVAAIAIGLWMLFSTSGNQSTSTPERGRESGTSREVTQAAVQLETPVEAPAQDHATPPGEPVRAPVVEDPKARIVRMRERMLALKDSEHWEKTYTYATVADLQKEQAQIEAWIKDASTVELERRFAAGLVEVVATGPAYTEKHFDPYDVYWVRQEPGKPWLKATLPEDQFPKVFQQKALSAWLTDRMQDAQKTAAR